MIPIVLVGAAGRMGRAVEAAAAHADDVRIKARVDLSARVVLPGPASGRTGYGGAEAAGTEDERGAELADVLAPGDVVIEFSSPAGCTAAARLCSERGAALVSGTTGLDPEEEAEVRAAAGRVAVLRAANFSLGVLALRRALAAALDALPAWDLEIIERHHRRKLDSPSGTALALAREAAARRGLDDGALRFGREGRVGARPVGEIGIHAVRGGTWTGDHAVLLAGEGEWLELRHVAEDRAAFAHGALAAARFVAGAGPGLYTLDDVVRPGGRTGYR